MGLAGPASRGGAAGTLRPGGDGRKEPNYPSCLGAAVPRTLALQLGGSRRERTRTDWFRRGVRIDAAAPRRCAPTALLSICRCSHLPVNKSILQFNAAASRPPGTDAAAEPPPPSPLPLRGASGYGRDSRSAGGAPRGLIRLYLESLQGTALLWVFPAGQSGIPIGQAWGWWRREEDDDLVVTLRTYLGASRWE